MHAKCLIAVAAPAEAKAVFRPFRPDPGLPEPWIPHTLDANFDLIVTGIGKSNAAGAVARFLGPDRYAGVLSVGVAGALPGSGLQLGQIVAATSCTFVDEGLMTDEGFSDCSAMGFPLGDFAGSAVPVDSDWLAALRPFADAAGPIATVSTCSGTDALAKAVRARTGALAEAMEGAAVALVARRIGVRAGEVRVISNTTGRRAEQQWDLKTALARLSDLADRWRAEPAFFLAPQR